MPTMKNCRNVSLASHLPSGSVAVANKPITNEPEMFTINVPHGNVSPNLFATKPDTPQRARLPKPPPTNIHSAFHINSNLANSMALVGVISTEMFQAVFPAHRGRQTPLPG